MRGCILEVKHVPFRDMIDENNKHREASRRWSPICCDVDRDMMDQSQVRASVRS